MQLKLLWENWASKVGLEVSSIESVLKPSAEVLGEMRSRQKEDRKKERKWRRTIDSLRSPENFKGKETQSRKAS